MKTVDELVKAKHDTRLGNHLVLLTKEPKADEPYGTVRKYIYHQTVICKVNLRKREVSYSTGGWDTSSTNRAINAYRKHYADFTEVPYVAG